MPLWTQPAVFSFTSATNNTTRRWFFQHNEDPTIGYILNMQYTGYAASYYIYSIEEGVARPAWRPTGVADVLAGSAFRTSTEPNNRYYYALDADNKSAGWTVPAAGAGMDSLVIYFTMVTGAGEMQVVKNPGGSEVVLGTVETDGTTSYLATDTITGFDPLVAGDIIAFRRVAGDATCRIQSFYAYDSDGVVSEWGGTFAIPSATVVDCLGSSVEWAYQLAPEAGGAVRFAGGYLHQGNAEGYCTEKSIVETWTRNSAAWTPATGWITGDLVCSRTANIDYDEGDTILGSVAYSYRLSPKQYQVDHVFTAAEAVGTGRLYPCMADGGVSFTTAFVRSGEYWTMMDTTPDDDSQVDVSDAYESAVKGVLFLGTPLGASWDVLILGHSHPWDMSFMKMGATNRKFYVNFDPTFTAGATCSCSWRARFTNILNRRQQARHLLLP